MKTLIALLLTSTLWLANAMAGEDPDGIDAQQLLEAIRSGKAPLILDTRSDYEYQQGHVPGAQHFPFWKSYWLAADLTQPADAPVVVYCEHGPRASIARFALKQRGFTRVLTLNGHMSGWKRAGLPVESGDKGATR